MSFSLLSPIKRFVWPKIQKNIRGDKIPSFEEISLLHDGDQFITITWEISRNIATSDLMISLTIEGLPDQDDSRSGKLDIQLTIPSSEKCSVQSEDITIINWDEVFDSDYDSLPDHIRDSWNK